MIDLHSIRKLSQTIKTVFIDKLAYVGSTWINVFSNIIQVVIFYYIWAAVFKDKEIINGISKEQIVTYIILGRIISSQFSNGVNMKIAEMIHEGRIGIELLRPIDFQLYMYFTRIGEFIYSMLMNGIPIVVMTSLFFGILPPSSTCNLAFFIISLFLSVNILFLIEFWIGLLSFFTLNVYGVHFLKEALVSFLSGALIPILFFPSWLKTVVNYLPFKDIVYTPLSFYLGIVPSKNVLSVLGIQISWILILICLTRACYRL